ncbi:MAG: hypothetical protein LWX55_15290, partial [Deltaproteobacteria bacterium]|nr:hypothetical protein [Deltaproteobacteria bacterium]
LYRTNLTQIYAPAWGSYFVPVPYQGLLANPGHFADELRAVPTGRWVIVDEVQRLPNLLNEVHRFIEMIYQDQILNTFTRKRY